MIIIYHAVNESTKSDYKWLKNLPEVDYKKYGNPLTWNLVSFNFLMNRIQRLKLKIKAWGWETNNNEKDDAGASSTNQIVSTKIF